MIVSVEIEGDARRRGATTFEELLPAIRRQTRHASRRVPTHQRDELMAEVVANCFCAYRRLVARGRSHLAYASPLVRYALRQIRAGRRVGGALNGQDVTSPYAQHRHGIAVAPFDAADARWREQTLLSKVADPAEIAAFRLDFAAWLASLSPRLRRMATTLASGETTSDAARQFGISPARVSQIRGELRRTWYAFHSEVACLTT